MRTTLTIEESIMQRLKEEAHKSGLPLKQIVNTTLEIGLRNLHKSNERQPYRLKTYAMGVPQGVDLDKALQMAMVLEDDEITRKLKVRK